MSILVPVLISFDYFSLYRKLGNQGVYVLQQWFFFLLPNCLVILDSLHVFKSLSSACKFLPRKKKRLEFGRVCVKSMDQFGKNIFLVFWIFQIINIVYICIYSNYLSSLYSIINVLYFSVYGYCSTFIKYIPKYFILFQYYFEWDF